MSTNRKDMYAEVAASLIEMMRQGIAPWSKPWICGSLTDDSTTPRNGATNRAYRGWNRMYLGALMWERGWDDPRFMT